VCFIENLYSPENGRNNNEFRKTVQINNKVTQIMTPTVNVNEHTTFTNLLHILHNRLSYEASVYVFWMTFIAA